MAKILLVTLSHNRKGLIGSAIQSVLNQTLSCNKFDYLLFDNNSSDGAKKIIDVVVNKHKHIHSHFESENLGQQRAYNKVLYDIIPNRFPATEVIGILDDDDELFPNALVKVNEFYDIHKRDNLGGSYSGFAIIDGKGRTIVANHAKAKLVPNQFTKEGQMRLRKIFLAANPCGHFRAYNVDALKSIGGFPLDREYATDYAIFGKIMEKYNVAKIDSVVYKFRQHRSGQIQSKKSPQQTADWKYYQARFREKWKKSGLV